MYTFDFEKGHVIGFKGKPVGRFDRRAHYVLIHRNRSFVGLAHRMIWAAAHGAIPDGMQINHKNSIRWDNRLDNLELVTPRENALHGFRCGLHRNDGEHHPQAKLSAFGVRVIRRLRDRVSQERIASVFGVSSRTIRGIYTGQTWA